MIRFFYLLIFFYVNSLMSSEQIKSYSVASNLELAVGTTYKKFKEELVVAFDLKSESINQLIVEDYINRKRYYFSDEFLSQEILIPTHMIEIISNGAKLTLNIK